MSDEEIAPRFWLHDGKRTTGPFSPRELALIPGVNLASLVCPEGLLGTAQESWVSAAAVEELAKSVPPAPPNAAADIASSPWPPDPSRENLDIVKTAGQRIDVLDRHLAMTQRFLTKRRDAYRELKNELKKRIKISALLETKMKHLAARMGGFVGAHESMESTRAAVAMQQMRIAELARRLDALGRE